jgi:hypothetical protein
MRTPRILKLREPNHRTRPIVLVSTMPATPVPTNQSLSYTLANQNQTKLPSISSFQCSNFGSVLSRKGLLCGERRSRAVLSVRRELYNTLFTGHYSLKFVGPLPLSNAYSSHCVITIPACRMDTPGFALRATLLLY